MTGSGRVVGIVKVLAVVGWASGRRVIVVVQGYRHPVEIISHCVWLYFRFPLSYREVEEMMTERGVIVSSEAIRPWCAKLGPAYAQSLRRRQSCRGDEWPLDRRCSVTINGKRRYLWRAVERDGNVLDVVVTSRRRVKAATRFFRKLLMGLRSLPRVLIIDRLASDPVAHRRLIPCVQHRRSTYLNTGPRTPPGDLRFLAHLLQFPRVQVDAGRLNRGVPGLSLDRLQRHTGFSQPGEAGVPHVSRASLARPRRRVPHPAPQPTADSRAMVP